MAETLLAVALVAIALTWGGLALAASLGLFSLSRLPDVAPAPAAGAAGPPTVAIVVPARDEAARIERTVTGLLRQTGVDAAVLVVDDGSTDATAERAGAAGAEVVSHRENRGLGKTFREGAEQALAMGADIIVNIDGDGQFDPVDIGKLVGPIVAGEAEMVTASRFADRKLVPKMPAVKRWGNQRVARIVERLTGQRFHDVSCGFRAFSREAMLKMNLFGSFTYTQETFLDLIFKDLRILEVPVRVKGVREFGESKIASSIPRYAIRSLQIMLRAFISYRPFTSLATVACVFGTTF